MAPRQPQAGTSKPAGARKERSPAPSPEEDQLTGEQTGAVITRDPGEKRRLSHIAFERRRREDLKRCFERLAAVTPGCDDDVGVSAGRPYKCRVVIKTIQHVKNLELQIGQLNARLAAANAQLQALGVKPDDPGEDDVAAGFQPQDALQAQFVDTACSTGSTCLS